SRLSASAGAAKWDAHNHRSRAPNLRPPCRLTHLNQEEEGEPRRMALKLEGKIAVVTGGSSGLGLATARRFVEEGAFVFITGRRQKELDEAVRSIGHDVFAVQGDMAVLADIRRLYMTIRGQKGMVDIVFANAGTGAFASLGQITEQHFDMQFNINV